MNLYIPFRPDLIPLSLKFIELTKNEKELFNTDIEVKSTYGSFPTAIWNSGRYLEGDFIKIDDIENLLDLYNSLGVSFRFTFANSLLTKEHLNNDYCNKILDVASRSGINEILIGSDILEDYIKEKYPDKFKFIISATMCIRDLDEIDRLCETHELLVLGWRDNNNDELLNKIKHKDKIEIMLNDRCPLTCTLRRRHHLFTQSLILNKYNGDEMKYDAIDCSFRKELNDNGMQLKEYIEQELSGPITIERMFKLLGMGFNNFKMVGRDIEKELLAKYYCYYFSADFKQDELHSKLLDSSYEDTINKLERYFKY